MCRIVKKNTEALKSLDSVETLPAIIQVSPFDTRFELGLSIRRKELEIYFFADQLSDDDIKSSLKIIFKEMAKNPLITLTVGTYQKFGPRLQWLESLIGDYSDKHIPVEKVSFEDLLPDKNTEEEEPRAKVLVLKAENDVISQFKTSRLVIDLGMQPDLYHQIAAISSGIPQINQVQSDYVTHQQNGYIISQLSDLPKGIDYFFKGLANWNKSLVYSIEKIADNTGSALISKWQSHLKGQDNNE
nr:accessory Sec system protein Asp1 [Streptococcus uberis]